MKKFALLLLQSTKVHRWYSCSGNLNGLLCPVEKLSMDLLLVQGTFKFIPSSSPSWSCTNTQYSLPFCRLYHTTMARTSPGCREKIHKFNDSISNNFREITLTRRIFTILQAPTSSAIDNQYKMKCFQCKSFKSGGRSVLNGFW